MHNRTEIVKLYKDTSLSPRTRQRKIQELMNVKSNFDEIEESTKKSENIECTHYQRGCLIECDKCKKYVGCRLCHSEVNRFNVKHIKCKMCNTIQSPSKECTNTECNNIFGTYFCNVCNLWDSTENSPKYHCEECGICRVGDKDNYKHCTKCGMCLNVAVFDNSSHNCNESSFKSECAICLEDMFDNIRPSQILKCGHAIHAECLIQYTHNDYRCPKCKKSMVDMSFIFNRYDEIVGNTENMESMMSTLPIELKSKRIERYCNDCEITSIVNFNPFGVYKCGNEECGSYNTQ